MPGMKAVFNGTLVAGLGEDYLSIVGFSSGLMWRTLAGYQSCELTAADIF
jgi:hypothetical protein